MPTPNHKSKRDTQLEASVNVSYDGTYTTHSETFWNWWSVRKIFPTASCPIEAAGFWIDVTSVTLKDSCWCHIRPSRWDGSIFMKNDTMFYKLILWVLIWMLLWKFLLFLIPLYSVLFLNLMEILAPLWRLVSLTSLMRLLAPLLLDVRHHRTGQMWTLIAAHEVSRRN